MLNRLRIWLAWRTHRLAEQMARRLMDLSWFIAGELPGTPRAELRGCLAAVGEYAAESPLLTFRVTVLDCTEYSARIANGKAETWVSLAWLDIEPNDRGDATLRIPEHVALEKGLI